jgi:hypothetical protein
MYLEGSVKAMERDQRGSSEKLIIAGSKTKKPKDWKEFLQNSDNKNQLVETLATVWADDSFAPKLVNRSIILVAKGHCLKLGSLDGEVVQKTEVESLFSNQEETDTRVVLYCQYAEEEGYETVRVRSPDSDIFFILLHHAAKFTITVLFYTGSGDKRRLMLQTLQRNMGNCCAQPFWGYMLSLTVTLPVHSRV